MQGCGRGRFRAGRAGNQPFCIYRATKDLYLTQRFARHSSPLTTTIYTHPTDEELYEGIRGIMA